MMDPMRRLNTIENGMVKLGFTDNIEIVIPDACDLVENTAAKQLFKFFTGTRLHLEIIQETKGAGEKKLALGTLSDTAAIRKASQNTELSIQDVSEEDDGFHLKQVGSQIFFAGANSRGVLYAVYAFEEYIMSGAQAKLDIKQVPYFRKRSSPVGYYHSHYMNLSTEEFTEEKAEYLARLGINQYCACDDGSQYHSSLHEIVKSDLFSFQKEPDQDYRRKIKGISEICRKYGIDYFIMLWEPALPWLIADIEEFPEETLGTVRRPWRGMHGYYDRTLCMNSPLVQAHYRNMMGKFVREFVHVKGLLFYNLDGNSWLCTPQLCERCAAAVKDSPHDRYNPWETQALLVSLLAEAAHAERPDFIINFWGDVHFHGQDVEKLLAHTKGYNALSTMWGGDDHDIIIPPGFDEPCDEFRITQKAAADRGVPMYMYFAYNRLESIQQGFPFPFHVCDAIRKFKQWGVRNLVEVTGSVPALNQINALTMKAFQLDPDRDPDQFLRDLAERQFGVQAGKIVFAAWEVIRDAMNVWSGYLLNPMSGSQPYMSLGTIGKLPLPILPDIADRFENDLSLRVTVDPWFAACYQKFRERTFLTDMQRMLAYLHQAVLLAKDAMEIAPADEWIDICYYRGSAEGLGIPTRKEYAEVQYAAISIAEVLCMQRVNILRAVHIINEIRACDASNDHENAQIKQSQYRALIREDIDLQEHFSAMLTDFMGKRPCLTRTGVTAQELLDFILGTRRKVEQLKQFLAESEK